MLSQAAFNALLKTLEEPPPHAKFVSERPNLKKFYQQSFRDVNVLNFDLFLTR